MVTPRLPVRAPRIYPDNPHVRICGGPGSATTLVYPTFTRRRVQKNDSLSTMLAGMDHRVASRRETDAPHPGETQPIFLNVLLHALVVCLLLAGPVAVSAQPSPGEAGAPPATNTAPAGPRWSLVRTLIGAGAVAFGAYWATSYRDCRITARTQLNPVGLSATLATPIALSPEPLHATASLQFGNAADPTVSRVGGQCQLDWSYQTRVWWTDDSVPGVPLRGSYRSAEQWRRSRPGPDGLPAEMEAGMQGTLRAEEFIPPDRLYVGLGAAAAGAVILAFFGRTAAPEVVVRPDVARLSWRFSF